MTTIWSDMDRASSWSWVTKIAVMPVAFWIFLISTRISSRMLASSAESGSSSSSTVGSKTMARASAMRCCWPPDSCDGSFFSLPGSRTISSALPTRRSISGLATLRYFSPKATLSKTLLCGKQRVVLEDEADIALVDRHVVDAAAADRDLAARNVDQPGDRAQDRRLAAAGRPEQGDEAALLDGKRKVAHGGELAVGNADIVQLDGRFPAASRRREHPGRIGRGVAASVVSRLVMHLWRPCPTAWSRRLRSRPSRSGRRRSATSSCRSDRRPAARRSCRSA